MSNNTQVFPSLYVDVVSYPEYNIYVAECLELPLVVKAETLDKAEERMNLAIQGYFKKYPEESKKALSQTKITAEQKTVLKIQAPVVT